LPICLFNVKIKAEATGVNPMIRIIVLTILLFILYWIIKGIFLRPSGRIEGKRKTHIGSEEVMVKDPECGVYIPRNDAIATSINGQSLYFCSEECLDRYRLKDDK
jgi:YHS domain-containing protein